jgi:hypothetical protein
MVPPSGALFLEKGYRRPLPLKKVFSLDGTEKTVTLSEATPQASRVPTGDLVFTSRATRQMTPAVVGDHGKTINGKKRRHRSPRKIR